MLHWGTEWLVSSVSFLFSSCTFEFRWFLIYFIIIRKERFILDLINNCVVHISRVSRVCLIMGPFNLLISSHITTKWILPVDGASVSLDTQFLAERPVDISGWGRFKRATDNMYSRIQQNSTLRWASHLTLNQIQNICLPIIHHRFLLEKHPCGFGNALRLSRTYSELAA